MEVAPQTFQIPVAATFLAKQVDTPGNRPAGIESNMSAPTFCMVDDKYVPLWRVMWVAKTPHFCGEDDCQCEGCYEVRLEQDEAVWATSKEERDGVLKALEEWGSGAGPGEGPWDG